ncbi:MAG TPA: SigE family RNA polymerase sigma factor [Jatrophihabitantaceae bacterium]|jgi:RNA polymerase sigma-70 factor (sigma-E family)
MTADLAFERFVREHTPTLYRTAFLLTGNRYEAEELLQDTLTRLYPKWDRVMSADKPIAYVQRCVGNRAVSRRRVPDTRAESRWELPDGWDGSDLSEKVAVSRTVWQLLGTLPTKQRTALVLRYFYDLPEGDVAEALGCRPTSVRSLVSRGIAAMRTAYFSTATAAEGSRR